MKRAADRDVREAVLAAENAVLRGSMAVVKAALATRKAATHPTPPSQPAAPSAPGPVYPALGSLVDDFLAGYASERKPAMFKKHQAALVLLRELHGGKGINALRQADIVDYFDVVEALPPRWAEKCKKRAVTARALAAEDHDEYLGKKTFDDNYVVPVRLFLDWAKLRWQDPGFPTSITTKGIEFTGEDNQGTNKQRAITRDELDRLFHQVLAGFRESPGEAHKWWLPALAFYTGARVNELCQLNPPDRRSGQRRRHPVHLHYQEDRCRRAGAQVGQDRRRA